MVMLYKVFLTFESVPLCGQNPKVRPFKSKVNIVHDLAIVLWFIIYDMYLLVSVYDSTILSMWMKY